MAKMHFSAALGLMALTFNVAAQDGVFTWQDYGKRLQASQQVSPLGPNFSGESVSLSNGALSFSATDLSLPGSAGLEVALTRSYSMQSRKEYHAEEMFADWSIDLPNISGVFTTDWNAPGASPDNRCSNTDLPTRPGGGGYQYSDYWVGLSISLPGGGGGDLLTARTDITLQKPTTGGPYPRVTDNGQTFISCLTGINKVKNTTGEAFMATMADGTRVWFDWMAQYKLPRLKGNQINVNGGGAPMYSYQDLRRNVLYATRVEDRFGNFVTYTYGNAWNAPGKLTKIEANDGRQITLQYSGNHVTSVSDGTRTWSYGYANSGRGRKTLRTITLPDAAAWDIQFAAFTDAEIKFNEAAFDEPLRSCVYGETPLNYTEELTGVVTHPAGGVGTFKVNMQDHGRSSVPVSCGHVTTFPSSAAPGTGNNTNDDLNLWTIFATSYTLISKQVTGPGIATASWSYAYSPGISHVYRLGATRKYPVCDWQEHGYYACSDPPCQSSDCAGASMTTVTEPDGNWTRYVYGNTFRYNEGKLMRVETGAGTDANSPIKKVVNEYDLDLVDKVYPATYGGSQKPDYDGFAFEYHRPLKKTVITQQKVDFKTEVELFDYFARPTRVTKSSAAAP